MLFDAITQAAPRWVGGRWKGQRREERGRAGSAVPNGSAGSAVVRLGPGGAFCSELSADRRAPGRLVRRDAAPGDWGDRADGGGAEGAPGGGIGGQRGAGIGGRRDAAELSGLGRRWAALASLERSIGEAEGVLARAVGVKCR